ncbi:MAG: DUF4296 domain-containing protein [Muribaculaceae bacterium]|nr:DUF4296 domain-containing protein [Muribaculaceae bacterium]
MRRLFIISFIVLSFLILFQGCRKTPSYVIPEDEMAALLADIHRGQGVVDLNRREWRSDSSQYALREAIYLHHGVTAEEVDTSLDWYGHHLDEYMKVYDKTIEILEKEISETDAVVSNLQMAVAGDSAQVWPSAPRYILSGIMPEPTLKFILERDENWENGDEYTWSLYTMNSRQPFQWTMVAEYEDGMVEWRQENVTDNGKAILNFLTDSTRVLKNIYGYLDLIPDENEIIFVDSLSLVRTRVNRTNYHKRFSQRKLMPKKSITTLQSDTLKL